jgi:hypothetical protein
MVGRTGNDILAFLLGPQGALRSILVCEAKCLSAHNATKATQAHSQLGALSLVRCPSGVPELIDILNDYGTQTADEWCERLRRLYFDPTARPSRVYVLLYATGDTPLTPKTRKAWLSSKTPDPAYKAKGPLEVIEVHISDTQDLVKTLYRPTQ